MPSVKPGHISLRDRVAPLRRARRNHKKLTGEAMSKGKEMIVAAQAEAAEAGADMLRGGGNAIDAAIACALV